MIAASMRYSRFVTWLKIGLPLAALGLLSTLFLFSSEIDPSGALPYADVDVEALIRDPRLSAPRFAGVTEDGTALTVTATAIRMAAGESPGSLSGEGITALIESADGQRNAISAASARFDQAGGRLYLDGEVRVSSAAGYDLRASDVTLTLESAEARSNAALSAEGPVGSLTAGGFTLRRAADGADPGSSGALVLVFTDGVDLIYTPPNRE